MQPPHAPILAQISLVTIDPPLERHAPLRATLSKPPIQIYRRDVMILGLMQATAKRVVVKITMEIARMKEGLGRFFERGWHTSSRFTPHNGGSWDQEQ
jgi:hypothetical protein